MPNTRLVLNDAAVRLLQDRAVFFGLGTGWQPQQTIYLNTDTVLEAYCHLTNAAILPQRMGLLSYSMSRLHNTVRMGRYCSVARNVAWMGEPHPMDWASSSSFFYENAGANILTAFKAFRARHPDVAAVPRKLFDVPDQTVTIGNDVWIGEEAMIAPGVTIGDGAVIGARALVLKDVPPYAVVVGSPARVLRMRLPEDLAERLRALEWWDYAPALVQSLNLQDPERFAGEMEDAIAAGAERIVLPRVSYDELAQACRAETPPA